MAKQPTGKFQQGDELWCLAAHIQDVNLSQPYLQQYGQQNEICVVIVKQIGSQEYQVQLPTGVVGRTTTRRLQRLPPNQRNPASQPPQPIQKKDETIIQPSSKKRGRPAKQPRQGPPQSPDDVTVQDWQHCEITIDQRLVQTGGQEYVAEPLYRNELDDIFTDFIKFFPIEKFSDLFPSWEQIWRSKYNDYQFGITADSFVKMIGIVILLSVYNQNIQDGFQDQDILLNLRSAMSEQAFRRFKGVITFPVLHGPTSRSVQAQKRKAQAPQAQGPTQPQPPPTPEPPGQVHDDSAPGPSTRGTRVRTAPASPDPGPGTYPRPDGGRSTTLEDDDQSEASSNESSPPDVLLSMEAEVIEDLRVNEEFVCDYLTEGYDEVIDLTEIFCMKWREAFKAGSCIVIDETMIGWSGVHSGRLMFIIRKPTPLGILLRTLCCGITGIILAAEVVEGKEMDQLKAWFEEYGHTTATTLRVTQPYHGTGRYVVADAWFGQVKCAYALRKLGLFCIMNVKNNHKRFPKKEILEQLKNRDDRFHMNVKVAAGYDLNASGHMDVQPMVLVHTTGTSLQGTDRQRTYRYWNKETHQYSYTKYTLTQPDVHARYREAFSKIDITNKSAVGHGSLTRHLQTTKWQERYFYGLLSLSITNSWKVNNMRRVARGERSVSIHMFLKQLGRRCLNNPFGPISMNLRPSTTPQDLQLITRIRHGLLVSNSTGNNPKCSICRSRATSIKCVCGASICTPRKHDCYMVHLLSEIGHEEWRNVRTVVLQNRRQ